MAGKLLAVTRCCWLRRDGKLCALPRFHGGLHVVVEPRLIREWERGAGNSARKALAEVRR